MVIIADLVHTLSAWLTPAVAVLGLSIAWGQYKNARYKLKLDLWDRRYEVYGGVMDLLAVCGENSPTAEDTAKFCLRTAQKRFLFDEELLQHIEVIRKNAVELRLENKKLERRQRGEGIHEEIKAIADQMGERETWLEKQIMITTEKFQPYLGFRNVI